MIVHKASPWIDISITTPGPPPIPTRVWGAVWVGGRGGKKLQGWGGRGGKKGGGNCLIAAYRGIYPWLWLGRP